MISAPKSLDSGIADSEKIEQSVRQLDLSTFWFRWNSIVLLILVLAALVVLSPPELLERYTFSRQLDLTSIVRGLLAVMFVLNIYSLYHQHHLERFRHRLVEQMQAAIKQRMRADKFYGLAILDPL